MKFLILFSLILFSMTLTLPVRADSACGSGKELRCRGVGDPGGATTSKCFCTVVDAAFANSSPELLQISFAEKASAGSCSQDARLCPDGSTVVRTGEDCQFSPCSAAHLYESTGELGQ